MPRLPRLEFASQVLSTRFAQLSHDLWILCRQPIQKFIKAFHGGKHRHRNFDSVLGHDSSVSICASKANRVRRLVAFLAARWVRSESTTCHAVVPPLLDEGRSTLN